MIIEKYTILFYMVQIDLKNKLKKHVTKNWKKSSVDNITVVILRLNKRNH